MKISYIKLKELIDYIQKEQRNIILEVENTKAYDREPLREKYKSNLYLYKVLNFLYSKKKYFNKHELYFNIKKNIINYNSKKPFYQILSKLEELN